MVNIVIRSAGPSDSAALSALAMSAKAHWGYPSAWLAQWAGDLTFTADYLRSRPAFVAEEHGVPVGVSVLELRGRRASLEHLWVAPANHGRGIGRMLVTRALEFASGAGVTRVEVLSDPFAEAFYLRLGACRVGERPAPMPGAPDRTLPLLEFATEPADGTPS